MDISVLLLVKLSFISTYKQLSLGLQIFAADHHGHSSWFYLKKLHYRALFTTSSMHFTSPSYEEFPLKSACQHRGRLL